MSDDHGAAGFCTDHAQAPDERAETVARVLRDRVNLDTGRYEGCEARLDEVILASHTINERILRIEGSPEVIASAVVAALDDETEALTEARDDWAKVAGERADQRDAARAALDRVRALADEHWDWKAGRVLADHLRAALDPEETQGAHLRTPPHERYDAVLDSGPTEGGEPR